MDIILIPALIGGVVGGLVVYATARRDLGTRRAVLAGVVTSVALALGWILALYGAVVGVVVAIVVYAWARPPWGTARALLAAGGAYLTVSLGTMALIYLSLSTM